MLDDAFRDRLGFLGIDGTDRMVLSAIVDGRRDQRINLVNIDQLSVLTYGSWAVWSGSGWNPLWTLLFQGAGKNSNSPFMCFEFPAKIVICLRALTLAS